MSDDSATKIKQDRQLILDAKEKGTGATLRAYTKLSGPGWLQSAITLGGGSLGGSLYLGVIGGYQMLWLQPIMMILGIVMLSAIGYVALSTGERPFRAINQHINPVLGWSWAIATLMANMVWAMPQFALGTAAIRQNLGLFNGNYGAHMCGVLLFLVGAVVVWFYDSGGWGIKLFEIILKVMVGVVVISFFGVVVAMSLGGNGLPWGQILGGFIPDFSLLNRPADGFAPFLAETSNADFWSTQILNSQRDKMVTAAATAVGINMTFLLPYSMLKRGWDRDFRGLAVFDLSTGLFVPFLLATSCVVIASATQFHGKYDPALVGEAEMTEAAQKLEGSFNGNLDKLLKHTLSESELAAITESDDDTDARKDEKAAARTAARNALSLGDKKIAAMLVTRDANALAGSLEGLTGRTIAQYVFGIGVVGMAISTIIILMLINGFTICEMIDKPSQGTLYRFGCILPGLTGGFGAIYLWTGKAKFWFVEPTSVFGMVLLPIAYVTFFFMMNSRSLLGKHMPQGVKRLVINLVMLVALVAASIGASWSIWGRTKHVPGTEIQVRWVALGIVGALVASAIVVHFRRGNSPRNGASASEQTT